MRRARVSQNLWRSASLLRLRLFRLRLNTPSRPAYFAALNTAGLFFRYFAHLRRQLRYSCGRNVPSTPRRAFKLASLHLHQTIEKTASSLCLPIACANTAGRRGYVLPAFGRSEHTPRQARYVLAALRAYARFFFVCACIAESPFPTPGNARQNAVISISCPAANCRRRLPTEYRPKDWQSPQKASTSCRFGCLRRGAAAYLSFSLCAFSVRDT